MPIPMPCLDCGEDTWREYYMVENDVWKEAGGPRPGMNGGGYLCVACLETRLGRQLVALDFADVPCNYNPEWDSRRTERLLEAMTR